MSRQPKSGSKSKKKPRKAPSSPLAREVPIDESTAELLRQQREAFRAKFGRYPAGNDPIFFDPDCDEPTPLSEENLDGMHEQMVRAMQDAGIAPELVHAYRRTGRLITESNQHLVPAEALDEWNAAVEEYFVWQGMAEKALKAGAHPAVAYAIGRTGKLMPEQVELTPDGAHAVASGEDAEWLEALNEYAELHPETLDPAFLGPRDPRRDPLH